MVIFYVRIGGILPGFCRKTPSRNMNGHGMWRVSTIRRFLPFIVAVFCIGSLFLRFDALAVLGAEGASGKIVQGVRVIPVASGTEYLDLVVYRGDYVKFSTEASLSEPLLSIPALGIERRLPAELDTSPVFKMKTTGTHPFSIGRIRGVIRVIDYRQGNYREITAKEALGILENRDPIILDVRTEKEYREGHLAGSVLIPVQELQRRVGELGAGRDRPILIYCATGNRSTVASKLLIDKGFREIYNLRYGIFDWWKRKLPIVR